MINTMPLLTILSATTLLCGMAWTANFDESKVPDYELPDLLVTASGKKVADVDTWQNIRRPEIVALFEDNIYGRSPGKPEKMTFDLFDEDNNALSGTAVRKQVGVLFEGTPDGRRMDILIYLPRDAKRPVPVFVGLNFFGNHTIHTDPGIKLSTAWMRDTPRFRKKFGIVDHRATETSRGRPFASWPVEQILARGYGLATIYYGDLDPDCSGDYTNGVQPLFYKEGQEKPAPDEWGSIAAWAWGLCRAMDYFETDTDIDEKRVAVMGHSRMGKAALWAGAVDQRFAITISNDSGCGGAALTRRAFGETMGKMTKKKNSHWLCGNFNQYRNRMDKLPVDQHMLIALAAPRPVYVASGVDDKWSDPRGEFLGARYASPVYDLFGLDGLPTDDMPPVDHPVMGTIGYHVRSGGHDVTEFDWQAFMDFADKHYNRDKK